MNTMFLKYTAPCIGVALLFNSCAEMEEDVVYSSTTTTSSVLKPFYDAPQPPPPPSHGPDVPSHTVVVEQKPTPAPTPTPKPRPVVSSKPKPTPKPKEESIPFGVPVPGKQGFVTSPYSPDAGYIDVQGFAPGSLAKDPYTNKVFKVP